MEPLTPSPYASVIYSAPRTRQRLVPSDFGVRRTRGFGGPAVLLEPKLWEYRLVLRSLRIFRSLRPLGTAGKTNSAPLRVSTRGQSLGPNGFRATVQVAGEVRTKHFFGELSDMFDKTARSSPDRRTWSRQPLHQAHRHRRQDQGRQEVRHPDLAQLQQTQADPHDHHAAGGGHGGDDRRRERSFG